MEEQLTFLQERYELAVERIEQIATEQYGDEALDLYFQQVASFIVKLAGYYEFVKSGEILRGDLDALQSWNTVLYEEVLPSNYDSSYTNPTYAAQQLGEEYGAFWAAVAAEMRSMIVPAAEQRLEEVLIRMELFVELYGTCVYEWQESGKRPAYEGLRQILYWYVSDYTDITEEQRIHSMVVPEGNFAVKVMQEADLSQCHYLYRYGEYVSENELKTAQFMAGLPQETIDLMADTYTEGYRIGFELGNKDLSKKKTAEIYYALGFERMVLKAMENLEKLGLKTTIRRTPVGMLQGGGLAKLSVIGGNPNKQYDFDHKNDKALFWDKAMVQRKLEVMRTVFEKYRKEALLYAGPAVIETFGEKPFEPINKKEALNLSPEQQKLFVEYRSQAGMIQREHIPQEERNFTIIAFPVPEIGEDFAGIFEDVIKINTLDYMKYRKLQQTLIDTLDQAQSVQIKGMNGNTTDLTVELYKLENPAKETIFENCVADVNIPVGEVFTSPMLKGTNGTLNVSKVYLNELEYRNLTVCFRDGMISDYSCSNFEDEAANRKYIKENILYHRETLPMGEFAIGTNTTAYVIARKWGIESKLPILIAEKMGPHFAVGDTCYSHAEDIKVYNPDGKEIVARENEVAALRKTEPGKAYFDCHTDITIPYDELGELTAVCKDGSRVEIIRDGRFVLEGCEELNEPFGE
ncbi:MAG: aminopeptidase [Lachnospiraceae bacterium]|nr:aminopeptidase [Lachnospiraceae bacterium]